MDNKINGISAGIGISYGYIDIDLGVTKSNNFIDNRLFSRGLTNSYSIDKDILSLYSSFTIKL
jgi:hypothetical protein